MIHETKREHVSTVTETTIECDICGAKALDGEWGDRSRYEHNKVTLSLEHSETYPESGTIDAIVYDCCPACFLLKVRPALEALGLKPRKTRVSY